MKCIEFVKETKVYVNNLIKSRQNLSGFTLKELDIFDLNQKYPNIITYESEIVTLVENYNLEKVSIGGIGFYNNVKYDNDYIHFGFDSDQYDFVSIEKKTGNIYTLDKVNNEQVFYCTSNDLNFLTIMYELNIHFFKNLIEDGYYEDEANSIKTIKKCIELTGDKKSEDFLKYVLAVD